MTSGLAEILHSSDWLPLRFHEERRDVTFVRIPRAERQSIPFLNEAYISPNAARARFSLDAIAQAGVPPRGKAHFIFHSSFCGSTLLAHAFDTADHVIGMSEPQILNDLGALAVRGKLNRSLISQILSLLCACRGNATHFVVKPTNEINFLITAMMATWPDSRALLLSSPLEDFLYSIARKGLPGRTWVRGQFQALRRRAGLDFGYDDAQMLEHTDMQVAALVWLQHRAMFGAAASAEPARFAGLINEGAYPGLDQMMELTARFLGIALSHEDMRAIAEIGGSDSKQAGRQFDPEARQRERASMKAAIGDEIDMVAMWLRQVADHARMSTDLPSPLI